MENWSWQLSQKRNKAINQVDSLHFQLDFWSGYFAKMATWLETSRVTAYATCIKQYDNTIIIWPLDSDMHYLRYPDRYWLTSEVHRSGNSQMLMNLSKQRMTIMKSKSTLNLQIHKQKRTFLPVFFFQGPYFRPFEFAIVILVTENSCLESFIKICEFRYQTL